jgi:hypothetical protein
VGFWDDSGDGLTQDHEFGIFDLGGGAPILEATVPAGGGVLQGHYRYVPIPPFLLHAGASYMIAATTGPYGDGLGVPVVNITVGEDMNLVTWGYYAYGWGLNYPTACYGYNHYAAPNFLYQPTRLTTGDAYVVMRAPNENHGTDPVLRVENRHGPEGPPQTWQEDALLSFDLTHLLPHLPITSATLQLYCFTHENGDPVGRPLSCRRILGSWTENTVTWGNQPGVAATATSYAVVPADSGWIRWDVTADVRAMVNLAVTNYGWQVCDDSIPWSGPGTPVTCVRAREHGTFAPCLEIRLDAAGIDTDTPTAMSQSLLSLPWPNPVGDHARIRYLLPALGPARLDVYDGAGRHVRSLLDVMTEEPGQHEVIWDGRGAGGVLLSSGSYFLRFSTGGRTESEKILLVR